MSISVPTNRQEFREFCLRNIGKGMLTVNITDEQVDDSIEIALSYYHDYHFDGSIEQIYKHQLTADDIANNYITTPERFIGIREVINVGGALAPTTGMFSPMYQVMWQFNFMNGGPDIASYVIQRQHLELIQQMVSGRTGFRWNRHENKLYLDTNWGSRFSVGDFVIMYVYEKTDPTIYPNVWKDRWLQEYATALMKYRYGVNLSKYEGLQLPGGVVFNATDMRTEAKDAITQLEDDMTLKYQLPPMGFIG